MNQDPNSVEESIRALEEEMRRRYGEKAPDATRSQGGSVYRSYEVPPIWGKAKRVLQWGGAVWAFYFLFFPSRPTLPLEGKLIAREMRRIDARLEGEVIQLLKSNGDSVTEGEVIGRILNPGLRREKERLGAETRVLEKELSGLRKSLEGEERVFATSKRLFRAGGLERLRFELQEMKVEEARSRVLVKEAELRELEVRRSGLLARLEDEIIKSPVQGIITSPVEEKLKAQVKEGETLAEVAYGGMRFEFRVKEEALSSIGIGQALPVRLEAFPGKGFKGKVEEIRPIVFEDNPKPWIKSYNARVLVSSVKPLPEGARLGMRAKSEIRVKRRTSRLFRWIGEWKERLRS